ncbi:MAG: hypothetical protein ACJA2R_000790, partial [Saprospiraceae bacterium]
MPDESPDLGRRKFLLSAGNFVAASVGTLRSVAAGAAGAAGADGYNILKGYLKGFPTETENS